MVHWPEFLTEGWITRVSLASNSNYQVTVVVGSANLGRWQQFPLYR